MTSPSHLPSPQAGVLPVAPTRVEIAAQAKQMRIDWDDGHHSRLPFWYLRGLCPCAVCQGHGGGSQFLDDVADTTLSDALEVGHYAINLVWQDGHRTGIWAWDTLRRLCPCPVCRSEPQFRPVRALLPVARQHQLAQAEL